MSELRECPFCKVKPKKYKSMESAFSYEIKHTTKCVFSAWGNQHMIFNSDGLKESWNTRHTPKHETVEQTIKNVCEQYDKVNGEYVASKNPGTAIYGFYLTKYKPEDV